MIFFDLRDRYGVTQIVFDSNESKDAFETAKKLSYEDVIGISGEVIARPDEAINKNNALKVRAFKLNSEFGGRDLRWSNT